MIVFVLRSVSIHRNITQDIGWDWFWFSIEKCNVEWIWAGLNFQQQKPTYLIL